MPNLTNSQEPEPVFWPLGAGAARKKIPGAGAACEKIQEPDPEPLEKKSQEPEAQKICRLPSPVCKGETTLINIHIN